MRKLYGVFLVVALALAGCNEQYSSVPTISAQTDPQPAVAPATPQPAPAPAAPAVQQEQGVDGSSMLMGGVLGYLLGSSGSSSQKVVVEREVRYVERPSSAPAAPPAVKKPPPPPSAAPEKRSWLKRSVGSITRSRRR